MFWLEVCAAICCFTCLLARKIPTYDYLEDNIYTELRSLLDDRDGWKEGGGGVGHPREERGWTPGLVLGQVAGVSVDPLGRPVLFHRGTRTWDYLSFNSSHHYQEGGPLEEDVVVVLDPDTGEVVRSWGRGHFVLPHGITVDSKGNTWLTDVALHQVFKVGENLSYVEGWGTRHDDHHLCKPTCRFTSPGGSSLADGYCNARILRFAADGTLKDQFGHQGSEGSAGALYVPHGLALDETRDALCVADRENHRVVCLKAGLQHQQQFGQPVMTLQDPNRSRVFDVAFLNGMLVGVGGSEDEGVATGFTADMDTGDLLDAWAPLTGFHNPHAISVSQDGVAIYVAEIGPNRVWKFVLDTPATF
nr:peptidyl-alpha-hydroxyglycine alpha-amidating lyase 2-like [Cherax quadricarinatus]